MKNLKNFLNESVLDVNKDDLKDQIQEKYVKGEKPYPNVKIVDIGEDFIRISMPNPNGDAIPGSFFNDLKVLDIKNIYLESFVVFQIDKNIDTGGLTIYTGQDILTYDLVFKIDKPVTLDGLSIEPEDKTTYSQIRVKNSGKAIFKNCDMNITAIRLDNPELVTFKNCDINDLHDSADGVVFDVVGSNKYVAQACVDALAGDFKGFEKLGFTPRNLKINKFTLFYADIKNNISENEHTFIYNNGQWSISKPKW